MDPHSSVEPYVADATREVGELYARSHRRVVGALVLSGVPSDVAHDSVQDAFAQALVHWERIRGYEDAVGWVAHVARRRAMNASRAGRRLAALRLRLQTQPEETIPASSHEFDEVRSAVAHLSKRHREVLVLHYYLGLPLKDIAAALDVAEGTVKAHLHEAREKLRGPLQRSLDG